MTVRPLDPAILRAAVQRVEAILQSLPVIEAWLLLSPSRS